MAYALIILCLIGAFIVAFLWMKTKEKTIEKSIPSEVFKDLEEAERRYANGRESPYKILRELGLSKSGNRERPVEAGSIPSQVGEHSDLQSLEVKQNGNEQPTFTETHLEPPRPTVTDEPKSEATGIRKLFGKRRKKADKGQQDRPTDDTSKGLKDDRRKSESQSEPTESEYSLD